VADPKQLKFQFVVDEASLQKTRQLIRELTADLAKLNEQASKAGGLGGGGGGAGVGVSAGGARSPEAQKAVAKVAPVARPLVQNLQDQKQIIDGVSKGSKDSLKVMNDSIKQSVSQQKRELDSLEASVKRLTKTYQDLGTKAAIFGKGHAFTPGLERDRENVGATLDRSDVERRNARLRYDTTDPQRRDELRSIYGETGAYYNIRDMKREIREEKRAAREEEDGPGAGLTGARKISPKMKAALGIAALVVAGVDGAIDQSLAGMTGLSGMGARRADIVSGRMGSLLGGDVKLTYAMKNMDGTQRQDLADRTSSFTAQADTVRESIGNTAANLPVVGGLLKMLGVGGGKGNNGGLAGAWSTAEQQSSLAEKTMAQAEAEMKRNIVENMAMDGFRGELGARIGAGRHLGLGRSFDKKTGKWVDSYGRLQNKLSGSGYSVGEYEGAKMGLQGMGGENFANQYAGEAMRANAQGLGGYGNLLAAAQRSGIGGDFARGSIGGGIDATAGVMLGSSILGNGFDPRGTTSGLGMLMAAQGGFNFTGNASDFNTVQRIGLGAQMGDSLVGGGLDPYQKSRNLVTAVNNNPGMSIYGQDYLANGMSMKQMMDLASGNGGTQTAAALGLDKEGAKAQLGASVTSVVDRFKDTGGSDPMSQTIRSFRKFKGSGGGGVSDFFNSFRDKNGKMTDAGNNAMRDLGVFYGIQTGQGEEAGLGLMGLEAGLSNAESGKLKKGSVGRGIGQTEKDAVKGMADAAAQVTSVFETMGDKFNKTLKDIPQDFTKMKQFGENLSASTAIFIESLSKLTVAVQSATKTMGGGFATGGKK
jgi:hypothetical protein